MEKLLSPLRKAAGYAYRVVKVTLVKGVKLIAAIPLIGKIAAGGIIIAAVIGIGANEKVRALAASAWKGVRKGAGALGSLIWKIVRTVGSVLKAVGLSIGGIAVEIILFIRDFIWSVIKRTWFEVKNVFGWLGDVIANVVATVLGVGERISKAWRGLVRGVKSIWRRKPKEVVAPIEVPVQVPAPVAEVADEANEAPQEAEAEVVNLMPEQPENPNEVPAQSAEVTTEPVEVELTESEQAMIDATAEQFIEAATAAEAAMEAAAAPLVAVSTDPQEVSPEENSEETSEPEEDKEPTDWVKTTLEFLDKHEVQEGSTIHIQKESFHKGTTTKVAVQRVVELVKAYAAVDEVPITGDLIFNAVIDNYLYCEVGLELVGQQKFPNNVFRDSIHRLFNQVAAHFNVSLTKDQMVVLMWWSAGFKSKGVTNKTIYIDYLKGLKEEVKAA